jgi:hypothetical protein
MRRSSAQPIPKPSSANGVCTLPQHGGGAGPAAESGETQTKATTSMPHINVGGEEAIDQTTICVEEDRQLSVNYTKSDYR